MPEEWSNWVIHSSGALRVGRVVRMLTGTGFAVAFAVVVVMLVTGQRFHHPAWVLIPGIPVLIVGQLWGIAVLLSREQEGVSPSARMWRVRSAKTNAREFFFAGLPRRQATSFLALVVLAEAVDLRSSSPQRLAASVFMAFYAIQTGISSAELARRGDVAEEIRS